MSPRTEYAIAEPSPARRFVWYPEDVTIIRRSRAGITRAGRNRVGAEDTTPWVIAGDVTLSSWNLREEAQPDEHTDPLDMAQCWRESCYHWVPADDDLGLCPPCVEYLRTL